MTIGAGFSLESYAESLVAEPWDALIGVGEPKRHPGRNKPKASRACGTTACSPSYAFREKHRAAWSMESRRWPGSHHRPAVRQDPQCQRQCQWRRPLCPGMHAGPRKPAQGAGQSDLHEHGNPTHRAPGTQVHVGYRTPLRCAIEGNLSTRDAGLRVLLLIRCSDQAAPVALKRVVTTGRGGRYLHYGAATGGRGGCVDCASRCAKS